jgi:hypothetical protein
LEQLLTNCAIFKCQHCSTFAHSISCKATSADHCGVYSSDWYHFVLSHDGLTCLDFLLLLQQYH